MSISNKSGVNVSEESCFDFRKILLVVTEVNRKGVMNENNLRTLERKTIDEMLKN